MHNRAIILGLFIAVFSSQAFAFDALVGRCFDNAAVTSSVAFQERRIETLNRAAVRSDGALIEALCDLGFLHTIEGRNSAAVDAYRNALTIVHRNLGVDSLEQIPVVDIIIDNLKTVGDYDEVNRQEQFIHHLYVKNFGSDDIRQLPAMLRLVQWYQSSEQLMDAIFVYENAIDLVERTMTARDDNPFFSRLELKQQYRKLSLASARVERSFWCGSC